MPDGPLIAILAAGASRRLGRPKQLVYIDGEPLIRRQCRVAIESGVGPVAAVCGCEAEACIAAIADLTVLVRHNDQWDEGVASSIREATRCAVETGATALLVLHCDQRRVIGQDFRALHGAWATSDRSPVCRACAGSYTGPPVILPPALFGALLRLRGDEGARSVLSALDASSLLDVPMSNAAHDLDLPERLAAVTDSR